VGGSDKLFEEAGINPPVVRTLSGANAVLKLEEVIVTLDGSPQKNAMPLRADLTDEVRRIFLYCIWI
jgi:hypothetical protein